MRYAVAVRIAAAAISVAALAPAAAQAQDACPNAQFRTGASAGLPDCRAWEQVSPVDKQGYGMTARVQTSSTADGNRFLSFATGGAVPTDGAPQDRGLLSARGADWSTRGVDAPQSPTTFISTISTYLVSDDHTKALVGSTYALAPGAREGDSNVYVRDLTQPAAYTLAVRIPGRDFFEQSTQLNPLIVDATPDLSTLVFRTYFEVLPDLPANGDTRLYFAHGGKATLASRLPDGTPTSAGFTDYPPASDSVLSDDGTAVTWQRPDARTYYRTTRDGDVVEIARQRGPVDPDRRINFPNRTFSAADGSQTIFAAPIPLTDRSSADSGAIYRYRADGDTLEDLTASFTRQARASFEVRGVSPDQRFVWFTTDRAFTAEDTGAASDVRLYVLDVERQAVELVAAQDQQRLLEAFALPGLQLSPDGRRAAILSYDDLTGQSPSDPSCGGTGALEGRCAQVYTFDAETPDDPLVCASCGPAGQRPVGARLANVPLVPAAGRANRVIADDGRTVFTTAARLVGADTDPVPDVYEYAPGVGPVLLTAGDSGTPASVDTLSDDGRSVFVHTAQRLVPQDADDDIDVYVARTDGGIASQQIAPPAPAVPCEGVGCHPAPASERGRPSPSSDAPPAPTTRVSPRFSVAKPSAKALRAAARSGRLTVAVKVTAPGTVSASLRGTLGGRTRTAASATRRASKAQTVRVPLRLSKRARSALRRRGKLALRLTVSYSERLTPYRTTVTIKKGGAR